MMESNFPAGNATIKQLQMEVLLGTKGQYTKGSNTHAGNAHIKQQQEDILKDTKGEYTKV